MRQVQSRLSTGLLWTALALAAYYGTALISGPIGMSYGRAAGFAPAQTIAQYGALAAFVLAVVAAAFVTTPVALRQGGFVARVVNIVPAWLLKMLAIGAIFGLVGIGTVGPLFEVEGVGDLTFAASWILVMAVLATLVIVPTAARARLSTGGLRWANTLVTLATAALVVSALAMLVSVAIVQTATPSAPGGLGGPGGPGGGPGGAPGAGQGAGAPGTGAPGAPGAPGAAGGAAPGAPGAPGAAGGGQGAAAQPAGGQGAGGQAAGGAQGGPGGPGGQSGPGGGFAARAATAKRNYSIGGGLMALLALMALLSALAGWRARGDMTVTTRGKAADVGLGGRSELGGAMVAGLVLTALVLAVIQLFKFPLDNPPPTVAAAWTSPETTDLVSRACMDCHSNETKWLWYAHVAPTNWLNAAHVIHARESFNLSELDKMPENRRASLGDRMARSAQAGRMPPLDYVLMHPAARLNAAEKQALIDGLKQGLAATP